ncbi:hypothetical protein BJF78_20525 [Pseudonocardia sp. CNS-139]|nr:hypothetical protein BJF78_20525 [Pseudonocardia sp. CNS-139]
MSLLAGFPVGWAIAGVLTLGVPLAVLGMAYGALVGLGYVRPGTFALAALLWLVGFPLSRLAHETFTPVVLGGQPTPPDDILTFLAFQGLVSMGFAVGFVWMFERITPPWLVNIKDHNPAAEQVYARYAQYAAVVWETRERRRARRSVRLADRHATADAPGASPDGPRDPASRRSRAIPGTRSAAAPGCPARRALTARP